MTTPPLRMGELVATLALAQDNAFGQPLESQLRSCLLAAWMGEEAGFDRELRDTVHPMCRNLERTAMANQVERVLAGAPGVAACAWRIAFLSASSVAAAFAPAASSM